MQHSAQKSAYQTVALLSGLLAFVLLLLTPFLPVRQTESSVAWPQQDSVASVNAPLFSLAPQAGQGAGTLKSVHALLAF